MPLYKAMLWNIVWGIVVGVSVRYHHYGFAAGFAFTIHCLYQYDIWQKR